MLVTFETERVKVMGISNLNLSNVAHTFFSLSLVLVFVMTKTKRGHCFRIYEN